MSDAAPAPLPEDAGPPAAPEAASEPLIEDGSPADGAPEDAAPAAAGSTLEVEINGIKYKIPKSWDEVPDSAKQALKRGGHGFLGVMGFYAVGWLYFLLLIWTVEWCRPAGGCAVVTLGVHFQFVFSMLATLGLLLLYYKYHELKLQEIAAAAARSSRRPSAGGSSASSDGGDASGSERAAGSEAESEDDYMEDEFGICLGGEPKLDTPVAVFGGFLGVSIIWLILAVHTGSNELNPGYVRARKFFSLWPLALVPFYVKWFLKDQFTVDMLGDPNNRFLRMLAQALEEILGEPVHGAAPPRPAQEDAEAPPAEGEDVPPTDADAAEAEAQPDDATAAA